MPTKRLRIFAGPNGSGKTTIINELKTKISFGVYVNADDIEKILYSTGKIDLSSYQIKITTAQIQYFIKEKGFAKVKLEDENLWHYLSVADNHIIISHKKYINSYLAADIAECIRQSLLASQISFSFETVMSHKDKLGFMEKAKQEGYKLYLYYIATEAPEININRVKIRIEQQGHAVNESKITDRYYRSLQNLKPAVKLSNRAYIFDNSGKISKLIAEITEGEDVLVIDENDTPNWFKTYLFE